MADVRILWESSRANHRITALDFSRAEYNPFRDMLGKIQWEAVLERGDVWESYWAPSSTMVPANKQNQRAQEAGWLSKELLTWHSHTEKVYRRWKEGQIAQENYINSVWPQKDGFRKAKAHLGLNMETEDMNVKKERFLKWVPRSKGHHIPNVDLWVYGPGIWLKRIQIRQSFHVLSLPQPSGLQFLRQRGKPGQWRLAPVGGQSS